MDYGISNMRTNVNACDCTRGHMDTVRESALKVDAGRKVSCHFRELNLHQKPAGPMLYPLGHIPTRVLWYMYYIAMYAMALYFLYWATCREMFAHSRLSSQSRCGRLILARRVELVGQSWPLPKKKKKTQYVGAKLIDRTFRPNLRMGGKSHHHSTACYCFVAPYCM